MSTSAIVLAAALLAGDHADFARQRVLKPFFAPPPGSVITVDSRELRDFGRSTDWTKLRGKVVVTPPKGHCLTVQRETSDDVTVCKKSTLTFALVDLDRAGQLHWMISTGAGDFGTQLTWTTPYRLITAVGIGKDAWRDPLIHRFIASCKAERGAAGRRIRLAIFGGEQWTIALPDRDYQPVQPPPLDNLSVLASGRIGVADAAKREKEKDEAKEAKEEGKAKEAGKGSGEGSGKGSGEGSGKGSGEGSGKGEGEGSKGEGEGDAQSDGKTADSEEKVPWEGDDRKVWSIPWRGAYVTNAAAFQPYGSVPPGINTGRCRYLYDGPPEDPGTGRMECHEVDGFASVLLPLTCLKDLRDSQ